MDLRSAKRPLAAGLIASFALLGAACESADTGTDDPAADTATDPAETEDAGTTDTGTEDTTP